MDVEFRVNEAIGDDGRQIFITATEFFKAKDNEEEFNSFAFATHAFFSFYGVDSYITPEEYEKILKKVNKGGAIIITMVEERYPKRTYPEVFVSNNNRLALVEL